MNERQTLTTPTAEAKFEVGQTDQGLPTLQGYALVWGATSSDRGGYFVRIPRTAAIEPPQDGSPTLALYAHDSKDVLGSTANGTLRMFPDDYGLRVEIDPPDTSYARDVVALVRRGDVAGMSFGMFPVEWTDTEEGGQVIRTYSRFVMDEVTITAVPAFRETSIKARFSEVKPLATPDRDRQAVALEEIRIKNLELDTN